VNDVGNILPTRSQTADFREGKNDCNLLHVTTTFIFENFGLSNCAVAPPPWFRTFCRRRRAIYL